VGAGGNTGPHFLLGPIFGFGLSGISEKRDESERYRRHQRTPNFVMLSLFQQPFHHKCSAHGSMGPETSSG
jgi:hypothetical protein